MASARLTVVQAGTEQSRQALLTAVGVVLAREGLDGLSLRKVAAQAGLSHAAPGVLFGGRAAMLTAYAAQGFERLCRCMDIAEQRAADGQAALAATGHAYVRFAIDQPLRFQVMFRTDCLLSHDPRYISTCQAAFVPLRRAIERGMNEGWIGTGDVEDVTLAAWSLVHGLAMLWFSKHLTGRVRPDPAELSDRITRLFAASIATRQHPPSTAPDPGPVAPGPPTDGGRESPAISAARRSSTR